MLSDLQWVFRFRRLGVNSVQRDQHRKFQFGHGRTRAAQRITWLAGFRWSRAARIEDEYGHQTGDDVLRGVAAWLLRGFRTTDLVARYGGEEFVVAFPDTVDREIDERLEELRNNIDNHGLRARGSDESACVTVSIGAARLPADGTSVQDVLALADSRLYAAKNDGRNRVVLG